MRKKITKNIVISSLFWKLVERGGAQGTNFLVSIVLARLLLPEEYGIIAIVMVFISLANVFVQSGLNTALIQSKEIDDEDTSTVFYTSLFIALILYVSLYFLSPYIANFYGEEQLTKIIRVLAITLFFGSVNSIQIAITSRNMEFKKLFYRSLGAMIISGIIGISMAYLGFGVWALVSQQLSSQIIACIIMWFTVRWRPKFLFSLIKLKIMFSFGSKILATNLLNALFLDLRSLIIGKIYTSDMLGYFNRGKQFPHLIINNINGSIVSVMLPTYSSHQDNIKRVKQMVKRSIVTSSFIIFPLMIGLAIVAEPLVKIVLTEKWLPSVPFLQIFCATYMLVPIHTANMQAIKALGYSNILLKIEILKKVIELIILFISLQFGIYAIALGTLVTSLVALFINSFPNNKLLNYNYKEQFADVAPSLGISVVMGLVIHGIQYVNLSAGLILALQLVVGGVVYLSLARIMKLECLTYLLDTIISAYKLKVDTKNKRSQ